MSEQQSNPDTPTTGTRGQETSPTTHENDSAPCVTQPSTDRDSLDETAREGSGDGWDVRNAKHIGNREKEALTESGYESPGSIVTAGPRELRDCRFVGPSLANYVYAAAVEHTTGQEVSVMELVDLADARHEFIGSLLEEGYETLRDVTAASPNILVDLRGIHMDDVGRVYLHSVWETVDGVETVFDELVTPGVEDEIVKQLILYGYDSPEKVVRASLDELVRNGGVDVYSAERIRDHVLEEHYLY